ncbi:MAG TPA: polysaccharide export protein, partial [Desulfobacterales bacterium]|nr:polysaccharide export protein [Desulfobacterales bacterium]
GLLSGAEDEEPVAAHWQFFLGPEDVLEISVWNYETLTRQVVVRPDGKISFPLIGDVQAQGRTVEELRESVEDKIKAFVQDAPVTVVVVEAGSPKVYVVGKVANPGVYIMGKALRVMQVLAMAGGATPFADKDDILIIRESNGRQIALKFNYGKVANGKDLKKNIYLEPGDTVVVP